MSLLIKRPQHALLPWRVIFVLTFLFVLSVSALVTYVNSAIATGCTTSSTTSGNYTIVSITTTGTCDWSVPSYVNNVDLLLVGGGGAGGSANNGAGGGGGGGQVKTQTNYSVSGTLTITVGAGGVPTSTASLTPGGDGGTTSVTPSSGSAITAIGGSGGASVTPAGNGVIGSPSNTGFNGGGGSTWAAATTNGSAGMVGGFSGGNAFGSGTDANVQAAGGGGGSGVNGSNAASSAGGNGGVGLTSSVTSNATFYGGGGGGGKRYNNGTSGTGGSGGGGNGGIDSVGANGTANTGGGGGGAGGASVSKQGGSGGSGIVVIKFISECNPTISTNLTNNYRYSFTTTGVCNWVTPSSSTSYKVLVVGAGGGGGYDAGGGGGGGAISYNSSLTFSANEILTLTIGSGGAGGTSGAKTGATGGTSSVVRSGTTIANSLGGLGGGGCDWNGSTCKTGSQTGNAGGAGGIATATGWTTYTGASGGNGFLYSAGSDPVRGSDGTSIFANYYSGGGGGGYSASGGLGGGGNGSSNASANTGGGGGGGNGNSNGGAGADGILLLVSDFDTPTLRWTAPSADETVTSSSYTPNWTLSDSTSGISSSSGTAKRQYATLTNGTCGSWTTEATQTRASPITLTSGNCYRWTFDSTLATGVSLPADNIGTPISSNLTSSIIKYDPAPTISSIVANQNDGIYNQDKTLTFTITFTETVTVTGNPILTLETGSSDLEATCSQSSVSTTMTCSATVRSGDASSDLDYVSTSALTLPSGVTIQDLYALNNAILTLPTPGQSGSISFAKNIVVAGNSSTSATGGSVTYANGYAIHTYTSTSAGQTFVPSSTGSYEVLVVGGGGGGGSSAGSGGGGGAVVEQTLALIDGTSYAITVGGGGAGASGATGQNIASDGTSSIFSNLITAPNGTGGRSRALGDSGTGNRGTGGNPGGGNGGLSCNFDVCSATTAIGSNGTLSSITGNYYGGGGGRGGQNQAGYVNGFAGGLGGGGNGGVSNGTRGQNGTTNTGGGGGGGSDTDSGRVGGNGADGIIVIRYKIDNAAPVISWSTPSSTSYVSTASYTPVWSVTDSGIAGISNSGTVTRQYKSLSSGTCSGSWTNDGTFSSNTAQTLTANRCYQWTFTTAPVDNASNTTATNLTSETVIFDSSVPAVSGFSATTSTPTASTTLEYELTFTEPVIGLDANDFTVTGWSVNITSGTGSGPYVITLTKTSSTDGLVSVVLGSSAVTDLAGNTLSSKLADRTNGVITYDGTGPTTPTISLSSSTCSSLRNTSVTATFSATDASAGLSGYRYTTDGSTPSESSNSASSVTIRDQGITTLKVRAVDNVGNLSGTASCVLDIDYVVPLGVWSSQPSTPTSQTSLSYVLTFDQDITGFSSSDLSISGTATSCSASVSGSGSTYTVTLASCSQGTIQLTLLANSVLDAHGNAGPAANASATQVTRSVLSVATDHSTLSYTYGSAITAVIPVSNSGGISSVSYSVSPSLPSGLSLNSSSGEITGTPSAKSSLNTYTISVSDSATTATSTFTLVVAAKELTVTSSSPSVTYGDPIPTITPSYSGFVLGDTSSVVSGTSCSTTYSTSSAVNTTPTTSCSGATADNYSFTYVSGTVTIAKADQSSLSVTTSSVNGIYGSTYTIGTSGGSGTGDVTYSVVSGNCSLSSTTISNTSAGDCYLRATKSADTNYNSATSSSLKFTILPKALVLVASSPSVTYGQSYSPTIIDTNSALVGSDAIGSATFSYSTSTPTDAGNYTITPSSAVFSSGAIDNYTVTYATGTLTIAKANQSTLTAVLASSSIEHRQTTTISSTGGSGSGSVTFSATGDCTVSGNEITTTQLGSCSLTATKAASQNYNSATSTSVTLTITGDSSAPTVVITSNSGSYSNSDTLVYSLTFSENISGLTTSDITASGWTKAITGSGSSYTLTLSSPNGTVSDGVITVTLASGSVTDGTNTNASAAVNTETIRDTTSPTSIAGFASSPISGTEDTSPQFVFSGAGAGEIYQCRINSGSYVTCSQTYKASGLSVGINTIYLRTVDLAGNFGVEADYSWTIIASTSNTSVNSKLSATPTPITTKTETKNKPETTKPNISNPLTRIPDLIKPLLDNLPFLPGESLVPKQLKPDTKRPSEIKPLEIVAGKEKLAELKIFEGVKTTFTNLGESVEKSEYTQPVALIVENKEGNFLKVTPVNESGPSVDTQNKRVIITAGSQIEIEANGYSPNSEFAVWLRSEPVFIGRGYVNRFGEIIAKFNLPKNVPLGGHKIEINGLTSKKEVRSVAVPATVIKNTNPGNIQLVTENPVEKYLNGLSVLMSLLFIVLMVGMWAVGATIRDQRILRAQIRK